jgi:hypothetical protein
MSDALTDEAFEAWVRKKWPNVGDFDPFERLAFSAGYSAGQKAGGDAVAWRHELDEPGYGPHIMLSLSPDNPWSHWVAEHLGKCAYRVTPLYAARGTP